MCGLNGAAGTLGVNEEGAWKDLLFMHALRGDDSTGAVSIGYGDKAEFKTGKSLGPPWLLMDMGCFTKRVMNGVNKVYIGHNRYATRGAKSLANCHPFVFDNVVGAHNGTVASTFTKDLPMHDWFGTDSEVIINSINETSVEETLKKLAGAWALTWYDRRDNTINLLRNSQRPLFFAFNKDRTALFWGSEVDLLAYSLNRRKIERDNPKSVSASPDIWYSWEVPSSGKAFAEPKRTRIEGLPEPEVVQYSGPFKRGNGALVSGITDWFGKKTGNFPKTGNKPGTFTYTLDDRGHMIGDTDGVDYGPMQAAPGRTAQKDDKTNTTKVVDMADAAARLRAGHSHERLVTARKGPSFPMIFRSANCKVYYDVDTKKYHRYYWSATEYVWHHVVSDAQPAEVAGSKLEDLLAATAVNEPEFAKRPDPPVSKQEIERWRCSDLIVRKMFTTDPELKAEPWIGYWWGKKTETWWRVADKHPPIEMPFTLIDVDSNHCFHTRKKTRFEGRKQFFKGHAGKLLSRDEFNHICEAGCLACSRIPRWLEGKMGGVRVHFINATDFLCEFCGENTETMKTAKKLAEEKHVLH